MKMRIGTDQHHTEDKSTINSFHHYSSESVCFTDTGIPLPISHSSISFNKMTKGLEREADLKRKEADES